MRQERTPDFEKIPLIYKNTCANSPLRRRCADWIARLNPEIPESLKATFPKEFLLDLVATKRARYRLNKICTRTSFESAFSWQDDAGLFPHIERPQEAFQAEWRIEPACPMGARAYLTHSGYRVS
jgi:hypothetical protein